MTNAVIAEHINDLERLKGEHAHWQKKLTESRKRHQPVRHIIRKIRSLQTKIMHMQHPKPKQVFRVPAETRRV